MVTNPPVAPLVWMLNIVCKYLSYPCQPPFSPPQIRYDSSQDLVSVPWLVGGQELDNYYDVGAVISPNLVETRSGWVEGYYMTSSGGRMIGAWEGIQYGVARRWESPSAAKGWSGVAETKSPGPDCLQLNINNLMAVEGSEDCLFLNVYSPVISGERRKASLPVLVYIHGGAFISGTGRYQGPSYLLNEDLLFVTINYRLGVLGFMSTGDGSLSGNWGLKDQTLALKWIQENIGAFGGNPGRVTLMGLSAGGASVHLHMMSGGSRGLFWGGISLSGTGFSCWALQPRRKARDFTVKLADYFSCPTEDWNEGEMVRCLRTIDPISLVAAQIHLFKWVPYPSVLFAPTLEPEEESEPFLREWPTELYKKGQVAPIPWITSVTEHEGLTGVLVLEYLAKWRSTKRNWAKVAPHILDLEYLGLRNLSKVVKRITGFYLGNKSPLAGSALEYSKMITDRYFHVPFVAGIQAHSQLAPTWAYLYAFDEDTRIAELMKKPKNWGAGHGEDEQLFVNSSIWLPGLRRSDPEYKLSKMMLNFVTNFVWNGTPSYTETEDPWKRGTIPQNLWTPVRNPRRIQLLLVDRETKMISPSLARVRFWEELHLSDTKLWVSPPTLPKG